MSLFMVKNILNAILCLIEWKYFCMMLEWCPGIAVNFAVLQNGGQDGARM